MERAVAMFQPQMQCNAVLVLLNWHTVSISTCNDNENAGGNPQQNTQQTVWVVGWSEGSSGWV
jgi:hypothetical protein